MIGVIPIHRDSEYFRETARIFGKDRSLVAPDRMDGDLLECDLRQHRSLDGENL